jgi:arylsulfatase A-like enzyme
MPTPNVLFILADDLGWGDVSCHGSEIDTPNIDRLFARGVELREHYVSPVCTPTRASLLTGRYPSRFGTHATGPSNDPVLPDGYETLATRLSAAGYDTGLFGKWHLGSELEYNPCEYGFDTSYGSLAGGVDPYNHRYKEGEYSRTWHHDGEFVEETGHVTDLIADRAVDWIEGRENPWFCYVPFTAVHVPIDAPEPWLDHYEYEDFYADEEFDRGKKRYAAYASHMDEAVGRLVEALKRTCQLDDTVIVFASDNGAIEDYPYGQEELYPGWHWDTPGLGSNFPLRGQKGQLYEGGVRTPTAVAWPGELDPGTVEHPASVVDWMPTLLNLAGDTPEPDPRWDGIDIWPLLAGDGEAPDERRIYWNQHGSQFALRRGDWKLIVRDGLEPSAAELYNITEDLHERADRSEDRPELVETLLDDIAAERDRDGESERADA